MDTTPSVEGINLTREQYREIVGKDSAILTNNSSDDQTIPPLLKRAFRYIEERNVTHE